MHTKKTIVLSTLLGVLVLGGVIAAQGEGDGYVSDSLKMLLSAQNIECEIRIETFVNGREYTARGRYEEQALPRSALSPFLRSKYRLDINFSMNSSAATDSEPNRNRMTLLCHPSDEREKSLIQQYTFIEGDETFITINLARLEERIKEANMDLVFTQVSEIRKLGGLAGVMRQIERFYEFSLPVPEDLQDEERVPALKLTGKLRNVYHKNLLAQFGGLKRGGRYPADFPSDIEIWIGRHNDFPYKIRYLRRISENSEPKEPLLQESFYKIALNRTPIPDSKFALLIPPNNVFVTDDTEKFIKALGLQKQ